ncbi:MAG: type II secretion system F family protein [Gammaproteobacteria bacterium]|nr:type II secretion system F family protein [Gammaproteobacteria bacterium]
MAINVSRATAATPATGPDKPSALAALLAPKPSVQDRMFFTEQLALLLESGMAVYGALATLRDQTQNLMLRDVIGDVMESVAGGRPLSEALARHPEVFSSTYVSLIGASEEGGFLHEVLKQLLRMDERREELRATLISAFTYPAFLMVFSILVVIFVLIFVFPKFGDLFVKIHDELPITTRVLLAVSDSLIGYWPYWVGGFAALVYFAVRFMTSERGVEWLDKVRLGVPLIRGIFAELYLVQALRVLSLSLGNGVPIVSALQSCRDAVSNSLFRRFVLHTEALVNEGGKVADGFATAPFIPDLAKQMIRTAEDSGNLALVCERMADFYERALKKRLDRLAKIIEPAMLLIMGVVVGIIVSSLILPIFKLSHAVG